MSIYLDTSLTAISDLEAFGNRLLEKFDSGVDSASLLLDVKDLEARIKALIAALPEGINLGDWGRKIHFSYLYLERNQPGNCYGDISQFVLDDLPQARVQVQKWATGLNNVDPELRGAVIKLIGILDFNSAIRAAFVVLTERMRTKFNPPAGLDGPELVNAIYGGKSTALASHLSEKERQPIRDYLSGAYGVLRNKYAHGHPPVNLVDLEATLATVNWALNLIGK